jgi:hypothetical protein
MTELSKMTQEQLKYLRQKWSSEISELVRETIRAQKRLDKRVEREETDKQTVELLWSELRNAKTILTHLQTSGADAEILAVQQDAVNKIQEKYDEESNGVNILTPEEAHIQQLLIEEMIQKKSLRENRISLLNALITSGN